VDVSPKTLLTRRPREQMVAERTWAINALTALLRTIDLEIDTRKALSHSQFKVIAGWRDRRKDSVVRICRQEVIRLAKRIVAPDAELKRQPQGSRRCS
jgi:transposase